jgi:hypothetical protein
MRAAGLRPPTFALLKRRGNFLCQRRHDDYDERGIGLAEADTPLR